MYITPDKIFEAFVGIANDLKMNDHEYLQLTERTNRTKYSRMGEAKFVEDIY